MSKRHTGILIIMTIICLMLTACPQPYPSESIDGDRAISYIPEFSFLPSGNMAVRYKELLDFYSPDGQAIGKFTPEVTAWTDLSESGAWDESFCDYIPNDKYVLVWFDSYGKPPVMLGNGTPTLANIVIFDHAGSIVREFPQSWESGVMPLGDDADFEAETAKRSSFRWLSDDILGIITGAEVWLYSVETGELRLAESYREELFPRWTETIGRVYGANNLSAQVKDGALYYEVGNGYTVDLHRDYRVSLWKVSWDSPPVLLTEEYNGFKMINGYTIAMNNIYKEESEGTFKTEVPMWYFDEAESSMRYIGVNEPYDSLRARQNLIAWNIPFKTYEPSFSFNNKITVYDLLSNETLTFTPTVENGGYPEGAAEYGSDLLEVSRDDAGGALIYYTFNKRNIGEEVTYTYNIACHSMTSGATSFVSVGPETIIIPPGDGPAKTFIQDGKPVPIITELPTV